MCRPPHPVPVPQPHGLDHVIPQTKGGSDHFDNLQLLYGACNSTKGTGTPLANFRLGAGHPDVASVLADDVIVADGLPDVAPGSVSRHKGQQIAVVHVGFHPAEPA